MFLFFAVSEAAPSRSAPVATSQDIYARKHTRFHILLILAYNNLHLQAQPDKVLSGKPNLTQCFMAGEIKLLYFQHFSAVQYFA